MSLEMGPYVAGGDKGSLSYPSASRAKGEKIVSAREDD
jgi:hypothetical protein